MPEGVTGLGDVLSASGLVVLHVALSALVTTYVLLRKREVAAAIGWIGLAWLSPLLGIALYYLLGINRVRQHTPPRKDVRDLADAVDIPPFGLRDVQHRLARRRDGEVLAMPAAPERLPGLAEERAGNHPAD